VVKLLDDVALSFLVGNHDAAAARRRLRAHAAVAPAIARDVQAQLVADGWDKPVLERIVAIVIRRAARLTALARG
jgi:hypothetical protein